MTISEHAIDSFSFLTIASVCMGIFRGKFLKETWSVLLKEKGKEIVIMTKIVCVNGLKLEKMMLLLI